MSHPSAQVRQLHSADELDKFLQLSYVIDDEIADDLVKGSRRPEWLWVAEVEEQVVGRAGFWSAAGAAEPTMLDIFDLHPDHLDAGDELLRAALSAQAAPSDYVRFLPPDWRDVPHTHKVVKGLLGALERSGARLVAERLRLNFMASTPLPQESGRLEFHPAADREELVRLMTEVLDGTLDAHSILDLKTMSPREAAEAQFDDEFAHFSTPREWWQVATLPSGEPVGFVVPARNMYHHIIAYIGVVPAHRGQGYIADLLARGTRTLIEAGAPHVRAATDLGNIPMAKAFHRAGYTTFQHAINMTWS